MNDLNFDRKKQQFNDSYDEELDENEMDEAQQEKESSQENSDEEDEEEAEVGEMKAKFDKIMANFLEENKQESSKNIVDYKDKNLQNNVKGIFQKQIRQEEQENIHAIVHGPNKEED